MRRVRIVFVSLLAVLLLAALTLRWWMAWPLSAVARHYGVIFERFERAENGRIVFENARFGGHGLDIAAKRVEGDISLWGIWGKKSARLGNWTVDEWQVVIAPAQTGTGGRAIEGWTELRARLDSVLHGIGGWFAELRLGEGSVGWKGGRVSLSSAIWRSDTVRVSDLRWKDWKLDAGLTWPAGGPLKVQLNSLEDRWSLSIENREPQEIEGTMRFRDQQASVRARFGAQGWLPESAAIVARDWVLRAADLGMPSLYEFVDGSLDLQWRKEGFSAAIKATARPAATASNRLPALNADIALAGDFKAATIERFSITGPGVEAVLAAPVTVARNGMLESPETDFQVTADLGKLSDLQVEGRIDGRAQVLRKSDGKLDVKGRFTGKNLHGRDWRVSTSLVDAEFSWPRLKIRSAEIQSDSWGAFSARGDYDFATHRIEGGTVRGELRSALLARWISPWFKCGHARISASVEGGLEAPSHHGEIEVEQPRWGRVTAKAFKGVWTGVGGRLQDLNVALEGESGRLEASAELGRDAARLNSLRLIHGSEERLSLSTPATIRWGAAWFINDFELRGNEGSLSGEFSGGENGKLRVAIENLTPAWWEDFVSHEERDWRIGSLELNGAWDHGPVAFVMEGRAAIPLDEHRSAEMMVSAHADAAGLAISRCEVAAGGMAMGTLKGTLPVKIYVHPGWKVVTEPDQALSLDMNVDRNAFFWKQVGELAGMVIEDPHASIRVTGTLRAPRGEATVEAGRIAAPAREGKEAWPALEGLTARVIGDGKILTLQDFSASITGQQLKAGARLPMPSDWLGFSRSEWLPWIASHLEAELSLPETKLSALSAFADRWVTPGGTVAIDVALRPGMKWSGEMHVRGAASRPLFGPLGALQDVDADIRLDERTVRIERLHASSGGQPVSLSGEAAHTVQGGWQMDLALKGNNLPLVRQSGLLLRSDVDLRIQTAEKGGTAITGKAILRDSLVLTDLRSLVSANSLRTSPLRRPPYFSITAEPFAQWKLAVEVEGNRFLRLTSPVFSGLASAQFRLGGTLVEPTAVGEVVIDEGRVTLPFATFVVEQGGVALRASSPFEPYVSLEAASRRLGYDLRMEMTGKASHPNVMFTSSPPLDSEQVLRLVMAGEAPQGETNFSAQQRALRLGAYLGQSLAGQLGADAFRSGNFSLNVGERVSREGRETYALELPLNKRWSLTGEYDEFDDYNVGVKWRAFRDRSQETGEKKQETEGQEAGKGGGAP